MWCRSSLIVAFLFATHAASADTPSANRPPEISIGVLATWSPEDCRRQWTSTADFLSQTIPGTSFVIRPLTYKQILPAVGRGEIDFLITNPALYASCEHTHHATRIATLVKHSQGRPAKTYAGAIICRADRTDLQSLEDLRGKTLMAVHPWSFSGWLMAQRELQEIGIHANRNLKTVQFAGRQDTVVDAVMERRADAGTLCAPDLDRMIASGRVRQRDIRILHSHSAPETGNAENRSTRMYPQWAFAKLRHTSDELAKRVAAALLQMPAQSQAALSADVAGWTIPLAYEPIHECLRELRVGPYEHYGEVTLSATLRAYWPWLVAGCLIAGLGWAATGTILWLNRRLRESETLRREAEKLAATGRLAAGVAHEINNPMGGIVNCLHLVRASLNSDHPAERYLAAAEKETTRVTNIVRQMLTLHRCRPERATRFRVGTVIEETTLMLQPVATQRNVQIESQVKGSDDQVCLPEESLRQVLFSLMTNAVEASPAGGTVNVSVNTSASCLELFVSDNGHGIPTGIRDRVFEPFFTTKSGPGGGIGLGLPISRGIVESLDGTLTLQSQAGAGTRFRIRLPLRAYDLKSTPAGHTDNHPATRSAGKRMQRIQTAWNPLKGRKHG